MGKIHKPTLGQYEIEAVVRAEAGRVGAVVVGLGFERDSRGVQVIRVLASHGAAPLGSALDRYSFRAEVLEPAEGQTTGVQA